jgi:hypothetical protein
MATSVMYNNKIEDLFSVVQNDSIINKNNITTIEYIDRIMILKDITQLKINWTETLHTFYQNQLLFNSTNISHIKEKLLSILLDTDNLQKINHLNRFLHLNGIFNILNELNASYNQSIDLKNFTLNKFQDFYLSQIINDTNPELINHWFDGIYNQIPIELYDEYHKSKYHKGIDILKNYLQPLILLVESKETNQNNSTIIESKELRESYIEIFIDKYVKWITNNFIENFDNNKMSLLDIFIKLNKLNKINEIFLDINSRSKFLNKIIIALVPCWKKYLETILLNNLMIDEEIINMFNMVDLTKTNYQNYTLQFMELWQANIKLNINPKNYSNSKLFESLRKISPIINSFKSGYNKSDLIIAYIKNLFLIDVNLLGYIMTGLNILIKNTYTKLISDKNILDNIHSEINNSLLLVSLYDNKEELWNQYFKYIYNRIMNITKKIRLDKKLINYEFNIFNQLVSNSCGAYSDKTKSLLNNIKSSIEHNNAIHKIKINYKNNNGTIKENFNSPDITKVDYTIFDKYIWDSNNDNKIKYNLIEQTKYPIEINTYLSVGKTYYDLVSETKKIDWDIENSIININLNKLNLILNIVQYTIVSEIIKTFKSNNQLLTKDQLIDNIVNKDPKNISDAKKYIESYISNMIGKDIIILFDGKLKIDENYNNLNPIQIDISNFIPSLNIQNIKVDTTLSNKNLEKKDTNDIQNKINNDGSIHMTKECISYLRLMMLIKMFKGNSTKIFPLNSIITNLSEQINKYVENSNIKLNEELKKVFINLINVKDNELIMELKSIEKRDIIEEVTNDSITGYIYVA